MGEKFERFQRLFNHFRKRFETDAAFREELLANPLETFRREGFSFADGTRIRVTGDTLDDIVIEHAPEVAARIASLLDGDELTENELNAVAGGFEI
ncbi:hypothetical protein SAMN05660649_00818 [Desulfotomaculum arcticum]|uniref:Uncharacterized protein n=1 Tax=Desulfotruncus arcticus DSM 17038 TaxID=1121424 RepID=A0A1I2PJ86_9FIRM|nr:hypothetical protein [Desulfotruncus arcticus]SFG13481.1 hypothetical protein SAMN05660649_00818 [Desulfotomaculum arcticum] [Desulfotruncus arcticus DSM 17038]